MQMNTYKNCSKLHTTVFNCCVMSSTVCVLDLYDIAWLIQDQLIIGIDSQSLRVINIIDDEVTTICKGMHIIHTVGIFY